MAESLYQGPKGGVLICHMDIINIPFAVKTGVSTTTSVGHTPITEGFTQLPTSPKMQADHTILVLLAPSKAISPCVSRAVGPQGQGAEDDSWCQHVA